MYVFIFVSFYPWNNHNYLYYVEQVVFNCTVKEEPMRVDLLLFTYRW